MKTVTVTVSFLGSKGGETRMIQLMRKNNPVEAALFVTTYCPNNSRFRRFAKQLHGSIKSRAKAALTAKAELQKFVQAK